MSKFCFIFPPVFLKKVHHAKLIRIGFLRLRTPCLLFAPCFFKGEHGVLYSHHLKGIKYSSIAIRTSACIKQSRVTVPPTQPPGQQGNPTKDWPSLLLARDAGGNQQLRQSMHRVQPLQIDQNHQASYGTTPRPPAPVPGPGG